MSGKEESCLHPEGLRFVGGLLYTCPACGGRLDLDGVRRWVQEAERARDETYSFVEGDGFGEIVREERQREVYRRRRVMYELENVPRGEAARPEMILVVHDEKSDSYECRIFYKEPRPATAMDRLNVEAASEAIRELRVSPDPTVRLASEKIEDFHLMRVKFAEAGEPAPARRVFYSNEL